MLIASTEQSFTDCAWVDENAVCVSALQPYLLSRFSVFVTDIVGQSQIFSTKCLFILYSLNTAHVSLQIEQAAFD